jgi:hypothetical protein
MDEVTLRSYHSFTREAKAVVLQRVIAADPALAPRPVALAGCAALFARAQLPQPVPPARLPLHLQMATYILQTSFSAFSDCSVVRYTFADCPAWLAQVQRYSILRLAGANDAHPSRRAAMVLTEPVLLWQRHDLITRFLLVDLITTCSMRPQWCARWNLGVSHDMSLLAVNAHAAVFDCIHVGTGEPYLNPTNPVATVYVPVVTQ